MNNRIATLRKTHGFSQLQLAQILHISPSAEGMYEQGRRTPSLDILIAMSIIFHVSLDYLITGTVFEEDHIPHEKELLPSQPCCKCCCTSCPRGAICFDSFKSKILRNF